MLILKNFFGFEDRPAAPEVSSDSKKSETEAMQRIASISQAAANWIARFNEKIEEPKRVEALKKFFPFIFGEQNVVHITSCPWECKIPKIPLLEKESSAVEDDLAKNTPKSSAHSSAIIVQGNWPLTKIKELIQEKKEKLKEITLNDADDEVIELLVKDCPQLTKLSIQVRNWSAISLTAQGLGNICNLTALKELRLNLWNTFELEEKDFLPIVTNKNFQEKLTKLELAYVYLGDHGNIICDPIASFQNLSYLKLSAGGFRGFTSEGIGKIFGAKAIAEKLKTFKFWQLNLETTITDDVMQKLSNCKQLEKLSLNINSSVTVPVVEKTLTALEKLRALYLHGLTLTSAAGLSKLESLRLTNWTRIPAANLTTIFSNPDLKDLHLEKSSQLASSHFAQISQLPLKSLSASHAVDSENLRTLCGDNSILSSTLEKFSLIADQYMPEDALRCLKNLSAVNFLNVMGATQFNSDTLEALTSSSAPLKENLRYLGLRNVGIDDEHTDLLSHFTKLKGLALSSTPLTEKGWKKLLAKEVITELDDIFFELIPWTSKVLDLFKGFQNVHSMLLSSNFSEYPPKNQNEFEESIKKAQLNPLNNPYIALYPGLTNLTWHPKTLFSFYV